MLKLKPHLSVEQIAKKHRLDVSFIQKQLDMGEPIEHEHTKDHSLAMDIALQHLDEIPDYYTRLKKMEADAKKEHKKFKDVKESAISELENGLKKLPNPTYDSIDNLMRNIMKKHDISAKNLHNSFVKVHDKTPDTWIKTMKEAQEEKRYCPLCDRKEAASECGYGENVWNKVTMKEQFELKVSREASVSLPKVKEEKLVDKILGELQEASKSGDSSLHDWFGKSKSSDGKPGWVQLGGKYAGKSCAKQPGQITKPKCGSSKMSAEMSPEEEDSAAKRKRREDPNPERKGKAKNVSTEEFVNEDACKEKVKSRYKIWPSAYASGAVVKCRKVGASNWGNKTKKESVTIEDANGNTFAEVVDLIKPDPIKGFKSQIEEATRLQSETGNILAVILSWRGKTYSIRMFFPQLKVPSKKDVTAEIQKVYPGAIVLQFNLSTLQAGMPLIQVVNSKSKNYLLNNKTIGEEVEELDEVAAWQRKEGKSSKGGLNEKGRRSYEKEHPGSNLQRPQPEGGSRRDSFCARMKGMKKKLTSAKTANDPDSRINKSLRAWNC